SALVAALRRASRAAGPRASSALVASSRSAYFLLPRPATSRARRSLSPGLSAARGAEDSPSPTRTTRRIEGGRMGEFLCEVFLTGWSGFQRPVFVRGLRRSAP